MSNKREGQTPMKKPIVLILPLLAIPFLNACEGKVFTVTFDVDGGSQIDNQHLLAKSTVAKPEDPTKQGYDFVNWTYNDQVWDFETIVRSDITLKANYVLHDYKVTFKNIDGTILDEQTGLHYGENVTYNGVEPTVPKPDVKYVSTFRGWDQPLVVVDDMVFTAKYIVRDKYYHVKYIYHEEDTLYELYTDHLEEIPSECPNEIPSEETYNNVHYRFLGWEKEEISEGHVFYKAKYDRCSIGLKFIRNNVTGYEGNADTIYIPEMWNGYKITKIETEAFKDQTKLEHIDIPSTVDDIYNNTFENCTALQSIEFKEGLRFIENNAFLNCTALKTVKLPNSLIVLSTDAFKGCDNLNYREYGNGYYLGNDTNHYLTLVKVKDTNRTTLEMNDKCESIASRIFEEYTKLHSITISSNLKEIGQIGFSNCSNLATTTYSGAKYVGNATNPYMILVKAISNNISTATVHENCVAIDEQAFLDCKSLKEVNMPAGLKHLSGRAFQNCSALKSIDIPSGIKIINYICFSGCTSLETVSLHDGLIYIEPSVFSNCTSLKSIDIPESVIYLGSGAFQSCVSLESIDLPNKLNMIDTYLFSGCRALTSISVPEGVYTVERQAFANCRELKNINIPSSVEYFGDRVISGCSKLETIVYAGSNDEWDNIEKESTWNQSTGQYVVRFNGGQTIE